VQNQGLLIFTDGTNYFTEGGMGTGGDSEEKAGACGKFKPKTKQGRDASSPPRSME